MSLDWLHYPDPGATELRTALTITENVPPEQILAGNGASELICAALSALRPHKILFVGPLFAEYDRVCRMLGLPRSILVPPETGQSPCFTGAFAPTRHNLRQIAASDADMVILCSPNNPGTAVLDDFTPLWTAVGNRTLLLDASYKDFLPNLDDPLCKHRFSRLLALAGKAQNRLLLLGSLTKFFCCPGLRLGFLCSGEETTRRVEEALPAWTISSFAVRAGTRLLAERSQYAAALPDLRRDVQNLTGKLAQHNLFRTVLSGVSFVSAALRDPSQTVSLYNHLLTKHGILIRVCDNIPGMPAGFVRIQARPPDCLAPLWAGLKSFLVNRI